MFTPLTMFKPPVDRRRHLRPMSMRTPSPHPESEDQNKRLRIATEESIFSAKFLAFAMQELIKISTPRLTTSEIQLVMEKVLYQCESFIPDQGSSVVSALRRIDCNTLFDTLVRQNFKCTNALETMAEKTAYLEKARAFLPEWIAGIEGDSAESDLRRKLLNANHRMITRIALEIDPASGRNTPPPENMIAAPTNGLVTPELQNSLESDHLEMDESGNTTDARPRM